jgi:hypothetical protein
MLYSIGCKVIFRIGQPSRYLFFVSAVPSRYPKSVFKNKKKIGAQIWARWPQIRPCSPTPIEVDAVAGSPRASVEQWESLDRHAVGAVGPHRLDRRVLLATAEHHLRLALDWSCRCRRLRPEPPRTPTWPSRFGRPP